MESIPTIKDKPNKFEAFRMLCIAPSNYGKSYLISNFVIERIKMKQFDPQRILIFSPTHKSDPS